MSMKRDYYIIIRGQVSIEHLFFLYFLRRMIHHGNGKKITIRNLSSPGI